MIATTCEKKRFPLNGWLDTIGAYVPDNLSGFAIRLRSFRGTLFKNIILENTQNW